MPRRYYVRMNKGKDALWIVSNSCEHARQLGLLYEDQGWELRARGSIPHHPTLDRLLARGVADALRS